MHQPPELKKWLPEDAVKCALNYPGTGDMTFVHVLVRMYPTPLKLAI